MSDQQSVIYARVTDEEADALELAQAAHERRTGFRPTQADIIRGWVGKFCASEGIRWPEYHARNVTSASKRRDGGRCRGLRPPTSKRRSGACPPRSAAP